MCHTEYSSYKCGHGTVVDIPCHQVNFKNKFGCTELRTDNEDDVTRIDSLCKLCSRDEQRRRANEPETFEEVEKTKTVTEDPNCGNANTTVVATATAAVTTAANTATATVTSAATYCVVQ